MEDKKNIVFIDNKNFYGFMFLILLMIIYFSGSIAYYNFDSNGVINASTAVYNFNISSDSISNTVINLGSTLKPYDEGSFTLNINMPDTSSDVQYSINIERINLPDGFEFWTADDYLSPFNNYTKYFNAIATKSDSVTIYWLWDGDVNNENDTSFIGKTISANLVIKSRIINGADMKNGASSEEGLDGTEFWSDTYRPYIRMINFVNNLSNVPSSCTVDNLCFDISYDANQNKKVYGYLIDSGLTISEDDGAGGTVEKILYNLYIASDSEIIAPSNCFGMFADFNRLESINFNNNFNTIMITNMSGMFTGCESLKTLDLNSFNTMSVTNMFEMFDGCSSLEIIDLSSFNTLNVTNMSGMFAGCESLKTLDLSKFSTANVTNVSEMFYNCTSLITLNFRNFSVLDTTNTDNIIYNCISLAYVVGDVPRTYGAK